MHEHSDNPWLTKILTPAEVRKLARALRAIEQAHVSEFRSDIFVKYQDLLGLHDWVERWAEANPVLARKLGVANPSRPPRRSTAAARAGKREPLGVERGRGEGK